MTTVQAQIPRRFFDRRLSVTFYGLCRIWFPILILFWVCGRWRHPMIWVASAVLIGVFQYHLNILGHEGLHFSLASNRRLNDWLCRWWLHGPQGAPLGVMRRNHLHHHAQLGDASDSDRQYYGLEGLRSSWGLAVWLWGSLAGGMTLPIIKKLLVLMLSTKPRSTSGQAKPTANVDLIAVGCCQGIIAAMIYAFTDQILGYLALWAIPLFSVMMGLNTIRSCLEHADLPANSPPKRDFTFISSRVERFFLAPFNMNYHLEHHSYMGVPFHQLPRLRKWMSEEGLIAPESVQLSYWGRFTFLYRNFSGAPTR